MDPSWTETAEEREKREREYLSKHVIGGREGAGDDEGARARVGRVLRAAGQSERVAVADLPASGDLLFSSFQIRSQKAGEGRGDDRYSREALFKRPRRSSGQPDSGGEFLAHGGSLKSRFGSVSYQAGSLWIVLLEQTRQITSC